MRNDLLMLARGLLLALLFIAFHLPVMSQQTYAALPMRKSALTQDKSREAEQLRTVLSALEESYQVSFNYNDAIVRDVYLDKKFSWSKTEKLEKVLARLSEQVLLKFEKVDQSNYLILDPSKKNSLRGKVNANESSPDNKPSIFQAGAPVQETPSVISMQQQADFIVSGVVKDEQGVSMPGVNVILKGTTTGTSTDADGKYSIELPNGEGTLIFSFIAFKTQEIAIENRTVIDVVLTADVASLQEVVVVGYGAKSRSEIIGSVATVTPDQIRDIPATDISAAMRGQIVGVGVNQVSGRPGAPITLNIRNASTSDQGAAIGATSEPLYIIDNIRVTRQDFDNLDLSMVESISILKDASAAIYGSSGSKGVILVTTKRGKAGKVSVTYNGYMGQSDAAFKPKMLSAYEQATMMNQINSINNSASTSFFSAEDLDYIKGLKYKSWFDEIWKPSLTQRHNVGISGGTERLTYFAGGSYTNENANYPGMNWDKYTFRSGMTADMGRGFKADVAFNVDQTVKNAHHNITDNDATFIQSIITTPQWVPISIDGQYVPFSTINKNPLAYIKSGYFKQDKTFNYRVNVSLTYEPQAVKGLSLRLQIAQSSGGSKSRDYEPPFTAGNFIRSGQNLQLYSGDLTPDNPNTSANESVTDVISVTNSRLIIGNGQSNSYQGFVTLTYGRTFGKHTFNIQGGGEQLMSSNDNVSMGWNNQQIPGGHDYWAFDPTTLTKQDVSSSQTNRRSFFGRFNYDFNKKYLLEAIVRRDASSNFALGNRWRYSPSIGVGWLVSKESFFEDNISFVNFLKLKANFGITGDDRVDPRLWQQRFLIDTTNGYLYGSTNTNSLNPSVYPNPNITWEKKQTINVGAEMSFFNNKVDLAFDFFKNKVFDGFDNGGPDITPLYAGLAPPTINYREAYNWGQEFTLGYKARIGEMKVNAGMNFAWGNSIVTKTLYAPGDLLEPAIGDGLASKFGTNPKQYNTSNYGLIYQGKFRTQDEVDAFMAQNPNYRLYNAIPQPGWMYFKDTNGDGVINDWDMVPMYKNTSPWFSPSINLSVTYKAFSLKTNIQAQFGGKVSYDSRARSAPSLTSNVLTIWRDRWTPDTPNGFMPRYDDPSLTRNSTFWMVDATMIRVNNMTLAYQIPSKIVARIGLQDSRILLTGNNLWTLKNPLKYKDPYTSSAYDYPILRTISIGFSARL